MRVAPVGLLYDDEQAYQVGRRTSELTHGHATASISTGVLCRLISQLRRGVSLEKAVLSALEIAKEKEIDLGVAPETSQAIEAALSLARGDETPSPELVEALGAAWVAEEALAISIYCTLVARDIKGSIESLYKFSRLINKS